MAGECLARGPDAGKGEQGRAEQFFKESRRVLGRDAGRPQEDVERVAAQDMVLAVEREHAAA